MHTFRKTNPRRPPDWRWQRADELLRTGRRLPRGQKDAYLTQCRRFRGHLQRCETETHYHRLMYTAPDMYEAWSLYNDDEDKDTRWELEARLLAAEDHVDIGRKMSLSPEAVACYEACFFNVSDRLYSPSYITQVVFGASVQAGLNERDYDLLWKMYGYWGGPHVLDVVVYRFNSPTPPERPENVDAFLEDDVAGTLRLKSALAMRMMPINWQTHVEIANLYLRMLEMERALGDSGGAQEAVLEGIAAFTQNLPWQQFDPELVGDNQDTLDVIDAGGVSLRANELVRLSAEGELPDGLTHMLDVLKFPETENAGTSQET